MKIELPDQLTERLNVYLEQTSFKSLQELVEFILKDYLAANSPNADDVAQPDEDEINKRLKDLGYF